MGRAGRSASVAVLALAAVASPVADAQIVHLPPLVYLPQYTDVAIERTSGTGVLQRGHGFVPDSMAGVPGRDRPRLGYVVSQFVVLDMEALYQSSDYGQRVGKELVEERAAITKENSRLTEFLEQEEELLGRLATSLTDHEFRIVSTAFDRKVGDVRERQDLKARLLQEWLDQAAGSFQGFVQNFVQSVARNQGYLIVMNSDTVIHSDIEVDITGSIQHDLRRVLGDGTHSSNYESARQFIDRGVHVAEKQVLSE